MLMNFLYVQIFELPVFFVFSYDHTLDLIHPSIL